ncbi:MAG: hypothetical protein ACE14M_00250 [Terriglobales bacterium]
MVGINLDLFSAIERLIEAHRINDWAKLIFSLTFSYSTTFAFACGSALAAHRPLLEAVGIGLVAGAVRTTIAYRRSHLAKGTIVALPAEEAAAELDSDTQVISR